MANTQRREHCYDPGLVRADRDNNSDPTGAPSLLIVNEIGVDAGSACVTPEQIYRAMRLAYTWRDCFVTSLNEIGEASRIVRHSQIEGQSFDIQRGKAHFISKHAANQFGQRAAVNEGTRLRR